jgi:hypothetical protein
VRLQAPGRKRGNKLLPAGQREGNSAAYRPTARATPHRQTYLEDVLGLFTGKNQFLQNVLIAAVMCVNHLAAGSFNL